MYPVLVTCGCHRYSKTGQDFGSLAPNSAQCLQGTEAEGMGRREGAKLLEEADARKPSDPKTLLVTELAENLYHGYSRMQQELSSA